MSLKVGVGLLLANGYQAPPDFLIGYSGLLQTVLTGAGNRILPEDRKVDACRVLFEQGFPVDHARNKVCRLFLDEMDFDYLLFLDADMKHPPDLLHRLVAHNVDIVTARYVMRRPPFFSVAMRKIGPGPTHYQAVEKLLPLTDIKGLIPIDAGGAGALLMSRRALEDVRNHLQANDWFRYQDGPDGLRSRSEDMWFYEQARACGYQPYLDADLWCGHVASVTVDPSYHLPYAAANARALAEEEGKPA